MRIVSVHGSRKAWYHAGIPGLALADSTTLPSEINNSFVRLFYNCFTMEYRPGIPYRDRGQADKARVGRPHVTK